MPTSGLATLEEPLALPGRDDAVEEALLGPAVIQVVLHDLVAERSASDLPGLECCDRVAQRRRKALRVRLICVPLERRREFEALLDPVQTRGDQRREGEVRVDVAAGNARLDALAAS